MFSDGPRNRARASSPKSTVPRVSDDDPLRVHTRYKVEPGRYSQRRTALPRSDRSVKLGSSTGKGRVGPPPSTSMKIESRTESDGFPGLIESVPTSTP